MPARSDLMPDVLLVGPVPLPIGGVSAHVGRLAGILASSAGRCTVIDAYASHEKSVPDGVRFVVYSGHSKVGGIFWLLRKLWMERGDVVHLHYSRVVGRFSLIGLLLSRRRRKVVLTLHHGDQQQVIQNSSWLLRQLAMRALKRMDMLVALSAKQRDFYLSSGISAERISDWPAILVPRDLPDDSLLPDSLRNIRAIESGGEETILVMSGYPNRSYRFEAGIEVLDLLSKQFPCRMVVCLYGVSSDCQYERELRLALSAHPRVILTGGVPSAAFLAILAKASVYLRPSTIDSYGLAVTDALNVGTPCIASNICRRDERCEIFPVSDLACFTRMASAIAVRGRVLRSKPRILDLGPGDEERILDFYRTLL